MKRRTTVDEMLVPGGAARICRECRAGDAAEPGRWWFAYALLSSISSAIRERADDHRRSTERGAISSASAMGSVTVPPSMISSLSTHPRSEPLLTL